MTVIATMKRRRRQQKNGFKQISFAGEGGGIPINHPSDDPLSEYTPRYMDHTVVKDGAPSSSMSSGEARQSALLQESTRQPPNEGEVM